jgi:hypothetical protein
MSDMIAAMTTHIMQCLQMAGAQGALAPFGLKDRAQKEAAMRALKTLCERNQVLSLRVGRQVRYVAADAEVSAEQLLGALLKTKGKGATVGGLAKTLKVGGVQVERGLQGLQQQGRAVSAQRGRATWWFAQAFEPLNISRAVELLEDKLAGDGLFDEVDIKAILGKVEQNFMQQVLTVLEAKVERLVHIRRASGVRRVFLRWRTERTAQTRGSGEPLAPRRSPEAEPLVGEARGEAPPPSANKNKIKNRPVPNHKIIIYTYQQLRQENGTPFVQIAALQAKSGVPLDILKAWIQTEAAAGRALLTGTNLAAMPAHVQAAAVEWQGELCLLVQWVGARSEGNP